MDRIIAPHTVTAASADLAPASGTPGYATDGNPLTSTPATIWPAYQYNAFQEELISFITGAGLTPDRTDNGQLFKALQAVLEAVAKLNAAQTFTASQRTTVLTDNDLSFDLSAGGNDYSATLAATGVLTFTNIADNAGKSGHIKIVNGSNYTVGAAATTKVKASSLAAISSTGTYLLAYWCDGVNVYITASSNLS